MTQAHAHLGPLPKAVCLCCQWACGVARETRETGETRETRETNSALILSLLTLFAGCCVSLPPVPVCDCVWRLLRCNLCCNMRCNMGWIWNGLDWSLGGEWSLDFYVTVSSIMSSRSLVLRVCPLAPWCSGSACCTCAWWCLLLHEPMCMRCVCMCKVCMCIMCMRAVCMCMRPCVCKQAGTVSMPPPPPLPTCPAPPPLSLNKTDSGKPRHATIERQCRHAGCRRPPYCL
jgi:hypothetical protein